MANPKKRTSQRKRNTRRSHHKATSVNTVLCNNCQNPKISHRVCSYCGHYKQEQVIETDW
ncbi:MAG: 50S ribosomal protein L32 [Deltaproteobacteria bacterium]|nr:MAG: 50S ribosomal protein L32 [Deltaproteobacteria bacterium]